MCPVSGESENAVSVGHLHRGEPDHPVPQEEALLEHLGHYILAQVLIVHMHHSVVTLGVLPDR